MSDTFSAAGSPQPKNPGSQALKYFLWSVIGAVSGAAITVVIFVGFVIPKFNGALDEDQKTIEGLREANQVYEKAMKQQINMLAGDLKISTENSGYVTLLYDADALLAMERAGIGLTQSFPDDNSAPYPGYPRWIVAGKIKPLLVGDAQGSHYAYFDTKTRKYEGTFLPKAPHTKK